MNNKGFTLIEVLAVVALLGIILIITATSINSSSSKTKVKILNTKISNIEKAAVLYAQDNDNNFSPSSSCQYKDASTTPENACKDINNCYCFKNTITVNNLVGKYIKADKGNDIIDPRDENKKLNDCKITIYEKYGKKYAIVWNDGACKR